MSGIGVAAPGQPNGFRREVHDHRRRHKLGIGVGANGRDACPLAHVKNKIIRAGDDGVDLNGGNIIEKTQPSSDAGGNGYRSAACRAATTNTFSRVQKLRRAEPWLRDPRRLQQHAPCCTEGQRGPTASCAQARSVYQRLKFRHSARRHRHRGRGGPRWHHRHVMQVKLPGADGMCVQANARRSPQNKVTAAGNDGFAVGGDGGLYEKNSAMNEQQRRLPADRHGQRAHPEQGQGQRSRLRPQRPERRG